MRHLELLQPCDYEPARHGRPAPDGGTQCAGCRRVVVDLSAMTGAEAHAFLDRRRDECVSLRVNERDEIVLRDVPAEPIVARIAANARPMILVAALMAAACGPGAAGEGDTVDARPAAVDAGVQVEEARTTDASAAAFEPPAAKDAGVARARVAHPPARKLAGSPPPRKPQMLGGY